MEPVRTCVGCRARAPRSSLLRIVARDGALVIDEKAVLPGRGAWVHDTDRCVSTALKRRAFGRALRASTPLDTAELDARTTRESLQRNG
ncbi:MULTISPECIES: YlxR family protein [Microbacterium]|uniref:YlxR family protein n=1 Tax=Microbacterium aquilitoris TaxID=3067307 RepID=A0ABU3GJ24_9MICO|nr:MULTISPECIES: YlxR family protein [unclassified Microbacterium]MDT3330698.1 YlxR family protein [Microbacterium sp. KSW-18]MDT3344547.1 YlxR family protein [Microbacterium sp. KSW2-22]SDG33907.1 hypothetical protein SAMN04488590_0665 [Microbacterium sp. 77mftsu3.1]